MYAIHIRMLILQLYVIGCTNLETKSIEIDLYSDIRHTGIKTTIRTENCTNLDRAVINTTSSVHTQANCVQLYDQLNCTGNTVQHNQRSPYPTSIWNWNFDDITQSVGICTDPCIPEIGSTYLQNVSHSSSPSKFYVKFYTEPGFNGEATTIEVNGCTLVSTVTLPRSVIVPKQRCVLAFFSGSIQNADEESNNTCVVNSDYSLLEFRYGAPSLDNITAYTGLVGSPKLVRAVSPCSCEVFTGVYWDWQANLSRTTEKYAILFTKSNFMGTSKTILLNFSDCQTFSAVADYREWDGIAESIYVSEGTCLIVYRNYNCLENSNSEVILTDSIPFLHYYNLKRAIRSIRICNASKYYEFENWKELKDNSSAGLQYYLITLACLCSALSLVITVILLRIWWLEKRTDNSRMLLEKLSEREIDEFVEGLGLKFGEETEQGEDIQMKNESESKISSDLLAQNQPYDYKLEIPASELNFDHKCPLGSGQFGNVFKATLTTAEPSLIVAVKTTKPYSDAQYLRALLKEIKIMTHVGQHSKIVGLIGCCTANLRKGELLIILEFCENGSLENYLKENRAYFVNLVEKGSLCVASDYLKIFLGLEMQIPYDSASPITFDIHQLLTWSIEIAEGMDYLASKKVIHGDLSARNVLLSLNRTAKVADFGLSRTIHHYTYYTKNGREPLPWRWLALESLKNSSFSTASDVWSFGILMWEIFTLAEQPYPGVPSLTSNFVQNLEQGLRPALPPFATSEIYNLMSTCWDMNPKCRPIFSSLRCCLKEIQDECKEKRKSSSD